MKHRYSVRLFSRRDALKLGGLAAVGTTMGCEALDLPEVQLMDAWPPISSNADHYTENIGARPDLDPDTHIFEILDRGTVVGSIMLSDLLPLASREKEHTLQCIGATPRFLYIDNAVWEGLPFREVLTELGIPIPQDALEMVIRGADDYHTSLPATDLDGLSPETASDEPLWLVWRMNGELLNRAHGKPFRFLTPGRYGTKNPKWPESLDFVDEPHVGHWESRGWSNAATHRTNTLVLGPPSMSVVGEGTVRILGSAFAGPRWIEGVEITTDGGATWTPATIDYQPGGHIWTLWSFDWSLPEPGTYELQARAVDAEGRTSSLQPQGTDRHQGFDGGMVLELTVT